MLQILERQTLLHAIRSGLHSVPTRKILLTWGKCTRTVYRICMRSTGFARTVFINFIRPAIIFFTHVPVDVELHPSFFSLYGHAIHVSHKSVVEQSLQPNSKLSIILNRGRFQSPNWFFICLWRRHISAHLRLDSFAIRTQNVSPEVTSCSIFVIKPFGALLGWKYDEPR